MNDETIAIRAYTKPRLSPRTKLPNFEPKLVLEFDRILVFDTETTTDLFQNLKFGYFKIFQYGKLESHALFYEPQIVKGKELGILRQFSKRNKITLYTLEQFRQIFLHEVYDLQSLCVGFNLPFDLSRIAIKSTNARFRRKGGFSLVLSKNLDYPRLHVTHITSTMSFIEFGTTKNKKNDHRGYFVDLRTLCYALTDKKHSLESACETFETQYKKQTAKEHGKITPQYIRYCINDVDSTYSLYQNAKKEFDSYGLKIPITKAYTPASIGKEFLKMIGVDSFLNKNYKFSNDILGYVMSCYFGGRTEDKIRKTPVLVDVLDFLSMYPTVCTLQNLWKFVIAERIEYREATHEITQFIDKFAIQDVQKPEIWTRLQGIVQVEPDSDVLPVRARYGNKHVWNIGINRLSSKIPLWYSIADVLASKLYTGKTPKIIQAYKFVPVGMQKGLKSINIQGIQINPYKDDLFKKLVEYKQELKNKKDRKEKIIKIIVNAISYGIFVEITTQDESEKIPVDVYGLEYFRQDKTKIEKSGFMFHPIIAISITSASRLLLATTEILLSKHDKTHAYCDTDSMMIPPEHTKEIQGFFQPLNPYNFDSDIFKKEGDTRWFYGISAKRYSLYSIENNEIVIDGDDYSSHGLGHLLDPFSNDDKSIDWNEEIWYDILNLHYYNTTLEKLYFKYENKHALSKFVASNPRLLGRLSEFNKNEDYKDQFKPFNFCILGFSNHISSETGDLIKPLAPFVKPARHVVYGQFVDYNGKSRLKFQGKEYWKPFWDVFLEYLNHSESKLEGDVGVLQRRHVVVSGIVHIGKESNNLSESEMIGVGSGGYEEYENLEDLDEKFRKISDRILELKSRDVKKVGISKQTLWNCKRMIMADQLDRVSKKVKKRIWDHLFKVPVP